MPAISRRRLSLGCAAFMVCMLIWAAWAEVDEVTHAEGQVIASQRIQTIQNLEGGILSDLLAREGQIVEQGDLLARLDNEGAASNYRDAVSRALEHMAALIRLEAELKGTPPRFPENPAAWLNEFAGAPVGGDITARAAGAFKDQTDTWQARLRQREAETSLMRSQLEQRWQEVEEQDARLRQVRANLEIAKEKLDVFRPLVRTGSYSKVDFMNLRSQVVTLQGELDTLTAALPRARAAVEEAERRMSFREAEIAATVTEETNRRRLELASLRETISAGGDRVTRTELRSPVRGAVRSVYINTVGGVVRPGEAIMDIVPLEGALLVEARVRTESNAIIYQGESLSIMPGMVATVDILTGKKTVLDYILKPVLKARQNALRER